MVSVPEMGMDRSIVTLPRRIASTLGHEPARSGGGAFMIDGMGEDPSKRIEAAIVIQSIVTTQELLGPFSGDQVMIVG